MAGSMKRSFILKTRRSFTIDSTRTIGGEMKKDGKVKSMEIIDLTNDSDDNDEQTKNSKVVCVDAGKSTVPSGKENVKHDKQGRRSRPIAANDWGKILPHLMSDCIIDYDLSDSSLEFHPPSVFSPCIENERLSLFVNDTFSPQQQSSSTVCDSAGIVIATSEKLMGKIFSFFDEETLLTKAFATCLHWGDWASDAHANLLLGSIQTDDNTVNKISLDRSWTFLHDSFPWACFLAKGGAKKVYKVFKLLARKKQFP
jgi:hypothetical protein